MGEEGSLERKESPSRCRGKVWQTAHFTLIAFPYQMEKRRKFLLSFRQNVTTRERSDAASAASQFLSHPRSLGQTIAIPLPHHPAHQPHRVALTMADAATHTHGQERAPLLHSNQTQGQQGGHGSHVGPSIEIHINETHPRPPPRDDRLLHHRAMVRDRFSANWWLEWIIILVRICG